MSYKIVFSDVDGTLFYSNHQLLNNTLYAIRQLQQRDIPFVIISARSPSGIASDPGRRMDSAAQLSPTVEL